MSDLISRQAAIDVVDKYFKMIELNGDICIDGLISLPSAQPETHDKRTETHACDCVSGVAAIIAAIEAVDEWDGGYNVQRANMIRDAIKALPSAQPQLDAEFAEAVRAMFADIWDREIDHPRFQDTVGEILEKVIELHNSVPPIKIDEWCDDCKEYDKEKHCCPRFNHVIRETLDDVRKEAYKHGKSKGIKRGLAMAQRAKGRWIHDGCDIPHGVDWMHCSVCGRREPYVPAAMTNYCPGCGTEMETELQ